MADKDLDKKTAPAEAPPRPVSSDMKGEAKSEPGKSGDDKGADPEPVAKPYATMQPQPR